ncbi:MAG TPA: Smr/MutS family protein [Qipengyuania sp.]|nr:Smr/MutS family protein [Qipengyuania sp.]
MQRLTEGKRRGALPAKPVAPHPLHHASRGPPPPEGEDRQSGGSGLDSHWERRLRAGTLAPDFTLDLHEHSLDAAYQRLLGGLDIARETGARVVLVIAGRERPAPAADRSGQRGAIRAKLLDWLAASRHGSAIAAIRKAHRRHGGEGALYVVLKRERT